MSDRRDDLNPVVRAVSDTLDELLWRHHGIATSWSNPESFLKWLRGRGYDVIPYKTYCDRGPCSSLLGHEGDCTL